VPIQCGFVINSSLAIQSAARGLGPHDGGIFFYLGQGYLIMMNTGVVFQSHCRPPGTRRRETFGLSVAEVIRAGPTEEGQVAPPGSNILEEDTYAMWMALSQLHQ
jgi:hypothetical protein